ncbi:MAG: DNA mismatch endonuclease Vsr [Mesorhizobium sp.]|nr:MAG: DNA mismatch endonuclease Vsr [Mesorhizobium sp.]
MKRVRQRDTKPELMLRRWLWARGVHFTTRNRDLSGSPDLANRKRRWAIFVHGCFWHGHKGCARFSIPKRNHSFWREKVMANKARDLRKARDLEAAGFHVVTIWQCEVERLDTLGPQEADHLLSPLRRHFPRPEAPHPQH